MSRQRQSKKVAFNTKWPVNMVGHRADLTLEAIDVQKEVGYDGFNKRSYDEKVFRIFSTETVTTHKFFL